MKKGRREFLLTGAAALPAALTLESLAASAATPPSGTILAQTHSFLIQPELFIRYDGDYKVVSTTPWGVAREDADLLPYVLGQKQLNLSALDAGLHDVTAVSGPGLDRLCSFRVQGEIPVTDVAGDVTMARVGGQTLSLSLAFFDNLTGQKEGGSIARDSGILIVDKPQANIKMAPLLAATSPRPPSGVRIPIYVPGTPYMIQFRGPDTGHNMAPCAPEPRSHYHLEVFRITARGNTHLANFHIGIWRVRSQICFAVANNYGRPACFRKCTPSWTDIKNAIQQALISIGIPLIMAAAIAAVVATIIYGSLVALALPVPP